MRERGRGRRRRDDDFDPMRRIAVVVGDRMCDGFSRVCRGISRVPSPRNASGNNVNTGVPSEVTERNTVQMDRRIRMRKIPVA